MRKAWKILLAAALMTAALTCGASAAEKGIVGVTVKDASSATPLTAEGTAPETGNHDGKTLYKDAVKLQVEYAGATDGKQYLIIATNDGSTVPTQSNIVYIDQAQASGTTVSFDVYPSSLQRSGSYVVLLTSDDGQGTKELADFEYWLSRLLGDVDGNEKINTSDALSAIYHYIGRKTLTGDDFVAADVDHNNKVNTSDALAMIYDYIGRKKIAQ